MKEAFKIHEVVSVRMPCGQEGHKGLLLGMMGSGSWVYQEIYPTVI